MYQNHRTFPNIQIRRIPVTAGGKEKKPGGVTPHGLGKIGRGKRGNNEDRVKKKGWRKAAVAEGGS